MRLSPPPSETPVYRTAPVVSRRQRMVFVALQVAYTGALLWLTSTLLGLFLSQYFGAATVQAVVYANGFLLVVWQAIAAYRTLSMRRAQLVTAAMPSGCRIAMATTLVPSREFDLLRNKLEGMVRVETDGNPLDLWVLDEEDDPRVKALVAEFQARQLPAGMRLRYFTRKNVAAYNEAPQGRWFRRFQVRQKGGNINAWLDSVRGERYDVLTFLDLDHVPVPAFYRHVLPFFRDPAVAFVQGPESFRNRDHNFVTRAASFERDTFFGLLHRSYFGLGLPVIVGAHTTFRADVFQDLGGAYPVHLTEDYLIMLRLRALGRRGVYVDQILAVGELPSTWAAYLGQQLRWASGGLDLLLRYFPQVWPSYSLKERLFTFLLLNYYVWGAFFMLTKGVLVVLLLCGASLQLNAALLAASLAFMVVSTVAIYVWERQYFIEPERRSFLLESALMTNFLGALYSASLLKAVIAPNSPFQVTAKSFAQKSHPVRGFSYPRVVALLLIVELACLVAVWLGFDVHTANSAWQINALALPLLMSVIANLVILVAYRRHEKTPSPSFSTEELA